MRFSLCKMAVDELSPNVIFRATEANKLIAEQNSKQAILCICQFLTNVVSVR